MITSLYLVEFAVADWPAAVAWYRDVLALPVVLQVETDRYAVFQAGSGRIALKEGRPEPGTVLLTFEVDDLDAELQRLARHGLLPESPPKTSPEGYRRVILRDPDGYRLSFFEWRRLGANSPSTN